MFDFVFLDLASDAYDHCNSQFGIEVSQSRKTTTTKNESRSHISFASTKERSKDLLRHASLIQHDQQADRTELTSEDGQNAPEPEQARK